jgi:hypothetical protein
MPQMVGSSLITGSGGSFILTQSTLRTSPTARVVTRSKSLFKHNGTLTKLLNALGLTPKSSSMTPIPWKKTEVLSRLSRAYFGGERLQQMFVREYHRIKQLHPDMQNPEIIRELFKLEPLAKIPREEASRIMERFPSFPEMRSLPLQ